MLAWCLETAFRCTLIGLPLRGGEEVEMLREMRRFALHLKIYFAARKSMFGYSDASRHVVSLTVTISSSNCCLRLLAAKCFSASKGGRKTLALALALAREPSQQRNRATNCNCNHHLDQKKVSAQMERAAEVWSRRQQQVHRQIW